MGKHYSKQEIDQIRTLVVQGLTNKEMGLKLERAEAGIRNIRHRLKLKAETQDRLRSLLKQKEELKKETEELKWRRDEASIELEKI